MWLGVVQGAYHLACVEPFFRTTAASTEMKPCFILLRFLITTRRLYIREHIAFIKNAPLGRVFIQVVGFYSRASGFGGVGNLGFPVLLRVQRQRDLRLGAQLAAFGVRLTAEALALSFYGPKG